MKFFEIHKYPTRKHFPVYGSINRLYIDLKAKKLYYWEDGQYFKISTDELDQAVRDEVEDMITAHTTVITNRLTELETSKADKTCVDTELTTITNTVAGQTALIGAKLNKDEAMATYETIANSNNKLSGKADKSTTLAGYGITDAYTKAEVDNRTTAVYRVKGNVSTYTSLPSTGQITGDVYNVVDTGINYVWNGTVWDDIGGVEAMATALEDGLMSKEDFVKLQALYTKSELDSKFELKSDKTYVDTQDALKADKTYVDSQDALKVDKNANITGATKTKITYDSKGLVTAGDDLAEDDIPLLPQSKINGLVTDLENKLDASKNAVATVGGLVSPTTVLSSNELVGVGTNGEQVRIQLGEGLTLEESTSPYTLKASGGGGGGGNQIYLHDITISINSFVGSFYLINDFSVQITSITNCNNGFAPSYSGYNGNIILSKMTGLPFDTHTIDFKNCKVSQASSFAEDSDGNQTFDCTDVVTPL